MVVRCWRWLLVVGGTGGNSTRTHAGDRGLRWEVRRGSLGVVVAVEAAADPGCRDEGGQKEDDNEGAVRDCFQRDVAGRGDPEAVVLIARPPEGGGAGEGGAPFPS